MPEQYIDDFTATQGLDYGDTFHMQRLVAGLWKDYGITSETLFGMDVRTKTATWNIQTLLAGNQTFEAAPSAGQIIYVQRSYAIYTPGSVNDGTSVQLLGKTNYESGGEKAVSCRFIFSTDPQASPLWSSDPALSIGSNIAWTFGFGGDAAGTTSDGTISVWARYAILTLS